MKKIGSIEDFYEWVKARDPEETYNYYSLDDCACARYCRERGIGYRGNNYPSPLLHVELYAEHAAQQYWTRGPLDKDKVTHLTMGGLRKELEYWINEKPYSFLNQA